MTFRNAELRLNSTVSPGALVTNEKAYQNAQKPHIQQISAKYCDLEAAKTITKITTLTMTTTTTP